MPCFLRSIRPNHKFFAFTATAVNRHAVALIPVCRLLSDSSLSNPIAGDQRQSVARQLYFAPSPPRNQGTRFARGPALLVVLMLVAAALGILALTAARHWPFTRDAVVRSLQEQSGGRVQLGGFRQTFFPHPGCVADGVTFRHDGNQASPPFITIRRLTIVGSYPGLLTHRIQQVRAEGMRVVVPHAAGAEASAPPGISRPSGIAIGEIIADGAQVEITAAKPGQEPLVFPIQKLSLHSIYDGHPLSFQAELRIPEPPGDVSVKGQFGPWKSGDGGHTLLSGSYTLEHADLGVFSGIAEPFLHRKVRRCAAACGCDRHNRYTRFCAHP